MERIRVCRTGQEVKARVSSCQVMRSVFMWFNVTFHFAKGYELCLHLRLIENNNAEAPLSEPALSTFYSTHVSAVVLSQWESQIYQQKHALILKLNFFLLDQKLIKTCKLINTEECLTAHFLGTDIGLCSRTLLWTVVSLLTVVMLLMLSITGKKIANLHLHLF